MKSFPALILLAAGFASAQEVAEAVAADATPATTPPPAEPVPETTASSWKPILSAQLSGGHDSNVPVLPEQIDSVSNKESAFLSGRAEAGARWHDGGPHRFRALANAELTGYTESEVDDYDSTRLGGLASWQMTSGKWMPYAVVSYNHYRIDDEPALDDLAAVGGSAYLHNQRHVTLFGGRIRSLEYDDNDPISGVLMTVRGSHWLVFGNPGRRIEFELELGGYGADEDAESYTTVRPEVSAQWRWDQVLAAEKVEVGAAIRLDVRAYDEVRTGADEEEESTLASFDLDGKWWLNRHVGFGAFLRYTDRASNEELREYDRTRIGVSADLTW